jgi:hypothetical protein
VSAEILSWFSVSVILLCAAGTVNAFSSVQFAAGGPLSAARRPPCELINPPCQINALGPVVTWGCMMVNALNLTAKSKGDLDMYPGYCPGRHFLFLLKYNASCEASRGHLPTGNPAAIYAASKALHQKSTPASALLSAITPEFISS